MVLVNDKYTNQFMQKYNAELALKERQAAELQKRKLLADIAKRKADLQLVVDAAEQKRLKVLQAKDTDSLVRLEALEKKKTIIPGGSLNKEEKTIPRIKKKKTI